MKLCRQYSVCDFKEIKANKKDIEDNKNLVYIKEYLQIKLGAGQGVELIKLNPPPRAPKIYRHKKNGLLLCQEVTPGRCSLALATPSPKGKGTKRKKLEN